MAYTADDVPFLRLLAKSADRSLADKATSALSGMVLKFDPEELRDDHGRWSAVGAAVHAIEHAAGAAHHDGPAPDPGKDKLKLHGKIRLDPGERLVGSSKVADEYGSVRLAATEKGGRRSLRIGVGSSAFGTRDDEAGPWTGGPDRHTEVNAERARLRAEQGGLEQRYDILPPGAERDQVLRRLDELDDTDTNDIYPDGYTATLDESGVRQLSDVLADVQRRAPETQRRMDAAWDQIPDGATNFSSRLHEIDPTIDPDGMIVLADGVIPGEWGDLHYRADLEEPGTGARMRLSVVPHGSTREQVAEDENDYVLPVADMAKLGRQLDVLMPATAGKSATADLVKWTYNPQQSRVGGRFASGSGSNITSGGDVMVSGRQGGSIAAIRPLNAAAARASSGKPINGAAARLTPKPAAPPVPRPAAKPKPKPAKPKPKPAPAKPPPKPAPGPEAATRSPHTGIGSQDGDTLTVSHRSTEQTRQADARERGRQAAARAKERAELAAVRMSLAAAKAKAKASAATTKQRDAAVNAMRSKYGIPKSLRHVSKDRQQAAADMGSATRKMVTDRARIATAQAQVAAVRAQYKKGQSAAVAAYLNGQLAKAQARVNAANGALSADQKTFDAAASKWRGH